jgi:hypothetical protein
MLNEGLGRSLTSSRISFALQHFSVRYFCTQRYSQQRRVLRIAALAESTHALITIAKNWKALMVYLPHHETCLFVGSHCTMKVGSHINS